MMKHTRTALALLAVTVLWSCSDDNPGTGQGDALHIDTGDTSQVDLNHVDLTPGDVGAEDGIRIADAPCTAGDTTCIDGQLATCVEGGVGWLMEECPEDQACQDGTCVDQMCEPGELLCATDRVLVCEEDGQTWSETECPDGTVCFLGECIECLTAEQCDEGEDCVDASCVPFPLAVVTETLPAGAIDTYYEAQLVAEGGISPYEWMKSDGTLPDGVSLATTGLVAGTPTESGIFTFTVTVTDSVEGEATAELELQIHDENLVIATESLPVAEEGFNYEAQLEALGGSPPYGWMTITGALPTGIVLGSTGSLSGVPSDIGDFPVTYRVVDSNSPPDFAERELVLTVEIAPLVIIGDQELNLWITKIIVLPLITTIEGIPIPYSTQLQARGGLRPYHWIETELPGVVRSFIPEAGIPEGLVLEEDGRLHGAVTDTSQVISVTVPFTSMELHGFFFTAEVSDSQEPAESKSAIFLIPTVPIGGS